MGTTDDISEDSNNFRRTKHRLEGDDPFLENSILGHQNSVLGQKGHHHLDVALQPNKYGGPLPYGFIYT